MNASTNYSHYVYNKYDDIASLELTVRNHPVSSFARFLLLKQYQKNKDPRLEDYAAQTALYFNDPQWLSFQLFRTETDQPGVQIEQEVANVKQEDAGLEKDSDINENIVSEVISANTPDARLEQGEKDTTESIDFTQNESESADQDSSQNIENREPVADTQTDSNDNMNPSFDAEREIENPLTEKANEEELIFEPLHSTDYFASQGVTIKEEMLMNDKLGNQMRSFSEWLKSMKQLHPGKLPEQNEVIEKIIQSSAEQSNVESEVLTEAMAEVLLKQNKQQKAIEMYEKLSLMNPSKSIYFAAKIDKIKNN